VHPGADRRDARKGRKELVGFTDGARESAQDWRDLLLDLKAARARRGRRGSPSRWRARVLEGRREVWPKAREQRCWVHKTGECDRPSCPEEPAAEGQARVAGDLDGRNQGPPPSWPFDAFIESYTPKARRRPTA